MLTSAQSAHRLVLTVFVMLAGLASGAPMTQKRAAALKATSRRGRACATLYQPHSYVGPAPSLWSGACGWKQLGKPRGHLAAVAIPFEIFSGNTPGGEMGNGNANPLCGKRITLTGDFHTVEAMIVDTNVCHPEQDCGLGAPASFDFGPRLWREFNGAGWIPPAENPHYLQQIHFEIHDDDAWAV